MAKFDRSYRVIIVGDASMDPYEINNPFGSVEMRGSNEIETPGSVVFTRMVEHWNHMAWINPKPDWDLPRSDWDFTPSIEMTRELLPDGRMFSMTLGGLSEAMDSLRG